MKLIILILFFFCPLMANDTDWSLMLEDPDDISYFYTIDNLDSVNIMAVANHYGVYRRILKSTDGGFTWEIVYRDKFGSEPPWYRARDISYPTKDFCIVSCDTSSWLRTKDGGLTWDTTYTLFGRNDFQGFRLVDMYDENKGIMCTLFHMIISDNGFDTWDTIPPFGPAEDFFIMSVDIISENQITLLTRDLDGSPTFNWIFYKSFDFGKTWSEYPHPKYRVPTKHKFVDSIVGYEIGSVRTGIGNTRRDMIYKTIDGGQSWFNVLDSMIEGGLNFGLTDLDFYDRDNGIVVGNNGKIYWTHDGGKSWVYDPTLRNTSLYGPPTQYVCMLGPRTVVICTLDGKIYRGESGISFVKTYDPAEHNSRVHIDGTSLMLWIEYPQVVEARLEIVNLSGGNVYSGNHFLNGNETEINIDISTLPAGSYLYRVSSNGKLISTGKFNKY